LDAINDRLHASGLMDALAWHEPPLATTEQMALAHTRTHLENLLLHHTRLAAAAGQDRGALSYLDPDTAMNPRTWDAVRRAAGAALAATDAVLQGEAENAFCAVRPPGHHACHDRAMGFCIFNNVAAGAFHALEEHKCERVAIVDLDIHHGNQHL
jgi:acetoin utilization deacetylase AcuC-like enzyme